MLGAAVVAGCGGGITNPTTAPVVDGGGGGGGGAPAGDFVNGNFEHGPGVGWVEEPAGLIVPASDFGVTAVSGTSVGWLGYAEDDRRVVRLSQTVVVPAAPVEVGFYSWVYSQESCDPPWWDTMGRYANGEPLASMVILDDIQLLRQRLQRARSLCDATLRASSSRCRRQPSRDADERGAEGAAARLAT